MNIIIIDCAIHDKLLKDILSNTNVNCKYHNYPSSRQNCLTKMLLIYSREPQLPLQL